MTKNFQQYQWKVTFKISTISPNVQSKYCFWKNVLSPSTFPVTFDLSNAFLRHLAFVEEWEKVEELESDWECDGSEWFSDSSIFPCWLQDLMPVVIVAGVFCKEYLFQELILDSVWHVQLQSKAFLWKSLKKYQFQPLFPCLAYFVVV